MSATSSLPTTRVAGRLSAALLLDFVALNRGGRGLVDGLILAAIVQGNLAPLARDLELQRAYAAPADAVPDALRRPVTVHGVAESLRLPYETVRRRVKEMAGEGLFAGTPGGVYVPRPFFETPERLQAARVFYGRLRDAYYRLCDLDALEPFPSAEAPAGDPPVRICMRAYTDYFLRIADLLTDRFGGLVRGLVLLGVLQANTEHFTDAERGGDGLAPADFPDDALRRPVAIVQLAARLGIPRETLRRHLNELLAAGWCARERAGAIVPAAALASPEWSSLMVENLTQLNRMFAALAALGVPALWESERAEVPARGLSA